MKHIGILAHSAEGSAACYAATFREALRRLGNHMHPEITLSIAPMGRAMDAWERWDLPFVRAYLAETARRLAAAGCDFFVCPDNTAHLAFELAGDPLALPGLHIAEVVAERARVEGRRRVGVLGTKWTMSARLYPDALGRREIEARVPPSDARALIDRVIFDELCNGRFLDGSRAAYARVIDALKAEGCDAVILGCTEIPLLVGPESSSLPTLDSTRLLAHAAVDVALGDSPMPSWRGGPVATGASARAG